jgi:GH24 family phage-related lysozyme (muramidase)
MNQAVLTKWHQFSEPLEGRVHSMYLDVKGLVTTGVGNLIDPVTAALPLPWKHADGRPASRDEIGAAWRNLKARQDLSKLHWKFAAKLNDLRLTDEDIDALVVSKLTSNARELRKAYPNFDDFPADAQLACLSMAWAVGPGFPAIFKNFSRFAVQQDWPNAKLCAKIKTENNPGIVPRNARNALCFDNAATVIQYALDRSVLHWPNKAEIADTIPPTEPAPTITAADRALVATQQLDVVGTLHADAMREMAGLPTQPPDDPGDA